MKTFMRSLMIGLFGLMLSSSAWADKIKEIKDRGTLRIGFAESIPMQFKDPKSNKWMGYNVDMAMNLAEEMGVKLEAVDAQWSTLIPGLMTDKWDICMVDMWATTKRAQVVVFTDSYYLAGWKMMARSGQGFETWEDLNQPGRVLVAISGTADEQMQRKFFDKAEVRALVTDAVTAPFLEVANGRADAILTDELNIRIFMSRNPNAQVEMLQPERTLSPMGFAYAIKPGDYHFLNMLNTWISSVLSGGKAAEVRKKWLEDYKF